MKSTRSIWLVQALFVTFLWSASKIIIKLGLGLVSPMVLIASIQVVSFLSVLTYYLIHRQKVKWNFKTYEIRALVLVGLMGYVAAPLFAVMGLKYVTGATAGLFAGMSSVLVMVLGAIILKERPRVQQLFGVLVAGISVYIFLGGEVTGGSMFGMLMLLASEASYALNTVMTRFVMRRPGDETISTSLITNGIGLAVLLPIGLLSGGDIAVLGQWQIGLSVLVTGIIFGFAGMMWSSCLDKLQALEAAIFQNTMLFQIAILAVVFLGEQLTLHNILGGFGVLIGAYLVDYQVKSFKPHLSAT
ncbi:DMT family transporter [Patescibacteria group bacterium]|nr:DMT family transporter [Patescibacteria group bacterium]